MQDSSVEGSQTDSRAQELLTPAVQIERLQAGDAGERYYAAWWLGRMRVQAGLSALIAALEDDLDQTLQGGYPLRRNAARALGKLRDPEAIPPLLLCLGSSDRQLWAVAAQALAEIAGDHPEWQARVIESLLACLASTNQESGDNASLSVDPQMEVVLEAVLEALGDLQAQAAISSLATYRNHPSIRMQSAANRALYRITGIPSFAEGLFPLLKTDNIHLRRAVVLDLGSTGYLAAASAIATASVEANIKLHSLKTLADLYLSNYLSRHPENSSPPLDSEFPKLLEWIDSLL
ncbi:MAG: HEAT repeat domain-containing protein [Cyanobacteriota bacterium]|nr:HEAT repeat domain-containing protein [Cyanobacteriota bacterium]